MIRIITIPAKYQAAIEIANIECFICKNTPHDDDCPIGILWSLMDDELRGVATKTVQGWLDEAKGGEPDWPDLIHEK